MLNWESSTEGLEQANWTNKDLSQLLMMLAPLHSWKESWFVPQGEPCLKSFEAKQVYMVLWTSLVIIWSYLWNHSVQCLMNISHLWITNRSALKPLLLTLLAGISFSFRSEWPIRASGSQFVALIKFRWPRLISEMPFAIWIDTENCFQKNTFPVHFFDDVNRISTEHDFNFGGHCVTEECKTRWPEGEIRWSWVIGSVLTAPLLISWI